MHIQSRFNESRKDVLHTLVRNYPLATFVVYDGGIVVNHFPLVIDDTGEHGTLKGHIPKSNELWKTFGNGLQAVAVFQGPEAYVTPSWYPSKQEHGEVVPTWNYVVVHAHGTPVAVHDANWLLEHLNRLTDQQEAQQQLPWKVSDAPVDFTARMLEFIVGVEMPISSIAGKWKLSQNRPDADRTGVAAGLKNRGESDDLAIEEMLRQRIS